MSWRGRRPRASHGVGPWDRLCKVTSLSRQALLYVLRAVGPCRAQRRQTLDLAALLHNVTGQAHYHLLLEVRPERLPCGLPVGGCCAGSAGGSSALLLLLCRARQPPPSSEPSPTPPVNPPIAPGAAPQDDFEVCPQALNLLQYLIRCASLLCLRPRLSLPSPCCCAAAGSREHGAGCARAFLHQRRSLDMRPSLHAPPSSPAASSTPATPPGWACARPMA